MMKNVIATRLLTLSMLGWAVFCPRRVLAQDTTTNVDTNRPGIRHEQLVTIGKDLELSAEDTAGEVVVIGGTAKIHGKVAVDVVVVGGDVVIDNEVGGDVVAVLGDVHIGPKARIRGQLIAIGGTNQVADGAKVEGQIFELGAGAEPLKFLQLRWLKDWFTQCVMEMRPLAPHVGWVWWIAGFFFIIYLLIAVLFPHPVQCCAAQISARPATTFVAGVLAKLGLPILCVVFTLSVVGVVVVPFLIVGAFLTVLIGKTAVLEAVGDRIGSLFGMKGGQRPLAAFLIGIVIVTLLYMVPVIGWLTLCFFGCWAMGAGVTALYVAWRSSRARPVPVVPPATAEAPMPTPPSVPGPPLTPPTALAYPRAGFWERMGAGFLDMVLITLASAVAPPFFAFVAIAYFSAMWAWKGTTVGGIVVNLQVVRQDGQPLGFLAAFVRSLAALFSAAILFLGFFWIGWDPAKQGWHDKIAGTVVVRLPRAVSLVCF
ncbi:MAG TPA: RDD family protein [Verrucomicrobiae bacterium]|jgi:uncharacterized RDD family membrane protein YckC|nr:RDD family protein [Verrucomicrobiae bacterium]